MNKIILWYNRNRKKIWTTIVVILLIILIVQILKYFNVKNKSLEQSNTTSNMSVNKNSINNNLNTVKLDEEKSTVSGENLTQEQISSLTVIDEFAELCNNKRIEEAYNLLTNECKEELYPSLEFFTQSYYNQIFGEGRKNFSVENWIGNIYKVKINEDALSTGIYTETNMIQDYMTIVSDGENYKLNINGYLGREEKNISSQITELNIELLEINTYMDYQTYKFKVTNRTQNTLILDDKQLSDSMYLQDENGIHYSAYTHEIADKDLEISPNETKEVEIKYYNRFSSTKTIKTVNFSRVKVINDNTNTLNDNTYKYVSIKIEL